MTLKLTDEQRHAVHSHPPGQPIPVEDTESRRILWLVSPDDLPTLWAEYLRSEVQRGIDSIDRGEVADWDPDAIKDRVRRADQNSTNSQ